jgi:hypothetical protein
MHPLIAKFCLFQSTFTGVAIAKVAKAQNLKVPDELLNVRYFSTGWQSIKIVVAKTGSSRTL